MNGAGDRHGGGKEVSPESVSGFTHGMAPVHRTLQTTEIHILNRIPVCSGTEETALNQ